MEETMPELCTMSDVFILNKIKSGDWIPSLDTGEVVYLDEMFPAK